ncbi:PREDICTED: uncharacterized protein LOC105570963, partial [Vollenhovia emeryi]|uniref:uncharacterized protein LOC105570963 n=1 Tax=Vollenhovia emeryi TaxID=411798 RepID=UPI0005F45D1D
FDPAGLHHPACGPVTGPLHRSIHYCNVSREPITREEEEDPNESDAPVILKHLLYIIICALELLSYFETLLAEDEECRQCFRQFRSLCTTLNSFSVDGGCCQRQCQKDEFYSTHVSVKCKSCLGKLCTVKRDLYNAVVMKCRFVSLVCKFPVKTLPAKACAVTRKIMKQNVEWVICEMKESECKYWRQSWNTCRNLTYNVGAYCLNMCTRKVCVYCLFTFLCS